MKRNSILGAGLAFLFLTLSASASTMTLNTISYNFPLGNNGGGGAAATLNGVPVEIFCDDFAYQMWVPYSYSANVTTLGTSANLSKTRFGGVSSSAWTTISLNDGNTTLDTQDDAFFNTGSGSSVLARYEMAAYLVSLYNRGLGNNTSNDLIQQAVWSLMDPKAEGSPSNPSNLNDASYLEQAASWYTTMNTVANQNALNSFLAKIEIVSPTNMSFTNGLGFGGFQEQIIVMTPEPRGSVWVLFCLIVGGLLVRRTRGPMVSGASGINL
jgi:hypothetical protein